MQRVHEKNTLNNEFLLLQKSFDLLKYRTFLENQPNVMQEFYL